MPFRPVDAGRATPLPKPRWRLWRAAAPGALFFLAFALVATLLRLGAGLPALGPLGDKLRYFAAHKDQYDVLFIGSSRIYRGVIPRRFDAALAAHGTPVRSFNFGIDSMAPHEANAVLRRLLALAPARLRWVVVEVGPWEGTLRPANRFKRRAVFWHDGVETRAVLRSTWGQEASFTAKADLLATHLLHFAARASGAGRGPDLLRAWLPARPRRHAFAAEDADEVGDEDDALAAGQGYRDFSPSAYGEPTTHPARRHFQQQVETYRAVVARLAAANRAPATMAAHDLEALQRQARAIRRAGAEPFFLVPPTPRPTPDLYHLAAAQPALSILLFNDPATYPELFRVDQRFDLEHLTRQGAERFSTLLAAHLHDAGLAPAEP